MKALIRFLRMAREGKKLYRFLKLNQEHRSLALSGAFRRGGMSLRCQRCGYENDEGPAVFLVLFSLLAGAAALYGLMQFCDAVYRFVYGG